MRESGERVGRAVVPTVWHSPLLSGASSHTSASCLQATKVSYGGAEQRRASELSCIFSCQSLGPEVPSWSPTYLGSSQVPPAQVSSPPPFTCFLFSSGMTFQKVLYNWLSL